MNLHRCGLCFHPFSTYEAAAACCTDHAAGQTPEVVEQVRQRRREAITMAARSQSPVWFVRAMAEASAKS